MIKSLKIMQDLRILYKGKNETFDIKHLQFLDPIKQFKVWFDEALNCKLIKEPNSIALATSSKSGMPSVRFVLLKNVTENGFQFFTNKSSKKGIDLSENPRASFAMYWQPLNRQVRVEGRVSVLPDTEIDCYFNSRPKDSQVGALVSNCQSGVVPSRMYLDERNDELLKKFQNTDNIERPDYWLGYNLWPSSVEFWQGQSNRLHDRLRFRRRLENEVLNMDMSTIGDDDWVVERLSP